MSAGIYNFVIEQGATLDKEIKWSGQTGAPINLTDYTAKMQVRDPRTRDLLIEFSTENSRIEIEPLEGKIKLKLTYLETSQITWKTGVYSLSLFSPDNTATRLLQGTVSISREATVQ